MFFVFSASVVFLPMKVEKNRFRVPVEIASHCDVTRNYISLRRTWNTRRASSQNNYGRGSEITVLQIDRKNETKMDKFG